MTALNSSLDFVSTVPNANPMASIISRTDVSNPSTEDWVNVFGPSGYNVQPDNTRHRKLGRVHLPDVLKVIKIHIDLFFLFAYCYFRQLSESFCWVPKVTKIHVDFFRLRIAIFRPLY